MCLDLSQKWIRAGLVGLLLVGMSIILMILTLFIGNSNGKDLAIFVGLLAGFVLLTESKLRKDIIDGKV